MKLGLAQSKVKQYVVIIVCAAVGIGILGFYQFNENLGNGISSHETVASQTVTHIEPVREKIIPQTFTIKSNFVKAEVSQINKQSYEQDSNHINPALDFLVPLFEHAFALSPTQTLVTSVEWIIPTLESQPYGIVTNDTHFVFFTEYNGSKIGGLNTVTNQTIEWNTPNGFSSPRDMIYDSGKVFFVESSFSSKTLAEFDPSLNGFIEWIMIHPSGLSHVAINSTGSLYFTGGVCCFTGTLEALNPSTNQESMWSTGLWQEPSGVVVNSTGYVYFADYENNSIAGLDPSTGVTSIWTIPTLSSFPTSVALDTSGNVYFLETSSNKIGRLDPTSNTIKEWIIPTSSASPQDMETSNNGIVYFTENSVNKIARLDTSTGIFTEWTVPTTNSGPFDITEDSLGQVYFTEHDVNKIGRLS